MLIVDTMPKEHKTGALTAIHVLMNSFAFHMATKDETEELDEDPEDIHPGQE